MKALLLAAGLGTRLQPFTFFQAKATLPLFGIPFIHYPLQYLKSCGINEVVINLHAHPDSVRAAVSRFNGIDVEYSYEPQILGTAGAIRKASEILEDDIFLVINGDMLTNVPLQQVLQQHRQTNAAVTLVVMKNDAFRRYSGLYFSGADPMRLTGIKEGEGEKYHYTGLQIVSPGVISAIPPDKPTEVFRDIYPQLIAAGSIHGFLYDGFWREIGTLTEYLETSLYLEGNPLPELLKPPEMQTGLVSNSANIEDEADVRDTIVMERATIAAGCTVRRCIIGPDVSVTTNRQDVALARGILPWYIHAEERKTQRHY